MDDDIDKLVDEIKASDVVDIIQEDDQYSTLQQKLSADNINEYIVEITNKILKNGLETLDCVQTNAIQTGDNETVESYSSLLKSIVGAVDTLTKINVQQMKQKAQKELKQLELETKERISTKQISAGDGGGKTTNNILVTTREDFFKSLKDGVIDIDSSEESDQDQLPSS